MIDISSLLTPIAGHSPCGVDMSFSPQIDAIVEARRFDDASLHQGDWEIEIKTAEWPLVIQLCETFLNTHSKDIRIAVWLAEAYAKQHQWIGLNAGFQLILGLCETFWDGLYPLPDEDGQEQRIGNLYWMLTRTQQLIKEIPLTEGKETAYSLIDFEVAKSKQLQMEHMPEHERSSGGGPLSLLESAKRKTSRQFFETNIAQAKTCLDSLKSLETLSDRLLGLDGPSFANTKDSLENIIMTLQRYAQESGAIPPMPQTKKFPTQETPQASVGNTLATSTTILHEGVMTRAQALSQLRAVAQFFRATEPHSPVAYLAEKAANWGEMPLHDWLGTVIKDPTSLAHVEELLGLQSKQNNET